MDMQVFQFETKTSLKKCPQSHKNQERIFVPGDIIGIIMTFDPFVHEDDVWFIVTKRKNGSKRLWKRKWSDLRTKITVAPTLACEEVPVCEIGTVGEDPKVRHFVCLRDAQCFCVKIGDGSRQNTLWVEIGLFRVWSSAGVDVDEIVFSHYSATSMALKKECGDGGGSDSKEQNVLTGNFPEHSEISTTEINSVNNKSNEITEKKNPGTVITSEN